LVGSGQHFPVATSEGPLHSANLAFVDRAASGPSRQRRMDWRSGTGPL